MTRLNNSGMRKVITASSVGTMIEWYDFYIFGSLATLISTKFFPSENETLAFLSTLATFAAGFIVRPFGALFFGRLGDLIGRKYTFMVTLMLMGSATFLIGLVPSYDSIGMISPILVLTLRLLQGLALGGEYGGAATYVAEHAEEGRRGFMTSWIQTTATIGLIVSLLVIALTRASMSTEAFEAYGWRIPFLVSIFMVWISYHIRKNMSESPLFAKVKAEGKISNNPLKESFGNKYNLKHVLLALLGVTMGQGVVWYTGQFYAMSFLEKVMFVPKFQVDSIMLWALCLGTPFFVFFGWLSDKVGRKWIMMTGMLLAILSYRSIYEKMYQTVNLENKIEWPEKAYSTEEFHKNTHGNLDSLYTLTRFFEDGTTWVQTHTEALKDGKIDPGHAHTHTEITINRTDKRILIFWVFIQVLFVTMVYGPIASFLVEMFPVKIRYTSMSLPYHIGNGIFGGLLPAISTFLVTNAESINRIAEETGIGNTIDKPYLEGLWYPIIITAICFIIGTVYLDNNDNKSKDE